MASVPLIPQEPDDVPARKLPTIDQLWALFEGTFPTESASVEALYSRARELDIVRCESCEGSDFHKEYGSREITCTNCGKIRWFTSGTFFDGIRRVRAWLAAIWMKENGAPLTSAKLHRLVGIAYSSAWHILKKIDTVLQEAMQEGHDVASTFFSITYCKRSRETPAREHPLAEQEEVEKLMLGANEIVSDGIDGLTLDSKNTAAGLIFTDNMADRLHAADSFTPGDVCELDLPEKTVYELLSAKPVPFAVLCRAAGMSADQLLTALTMLQLAGLVTSLPGQQYVRSPGEQHRAQRNMIHQAAVGSQHSAEIKTIIDDFVEFIRVDYHGISRKYVQNYLGAYWCYKDRTRWPVGGLLKACLKFRRIRSKEILAYVSPAIVKLLPLQMLKS